MQVRFSFVDVFAEAPLTGNPLAVVPDAASLDEATMQRIAAELNQAETTFVLPPSNGQATRRLRSFTAAGHEVYGAGHNALGAWWWLAESGTLELHDGCNHFFQEIGDAILPVEIRKTDDNLDAVVLTQSPPAFGATYDDFDQLAGALGISADSFVPLLPPQVVSTGAGHLLVAVRDRSVVANAEPDNPRLARVLAAGGGEGCYLYCLDPVSPSSTAHARFFNPTVGLFEDSATGTAAGPLACLLVKHGIVADGSTITIEQGYAMGRPSLLRIEVNAGTVKLAGRGITVIDGTLRVR